MLPLERMKYLLRVFLFNVFALWLTSQIIPGLIISGSWQSILFSGLILSLLMLIVAPLLKILFIPINIITFGLFSWFINVIIIYLLTIFVPDITVQPWTFEGIQWGGFVIPPFELSYFISLIVVSLTVTFISHILHDISES